jgi:hypothetical protein
MGKIMGEDLCSVDVLTCLRQQTAALERLAALHESRLTRSFTLDADPDADREKNVASTLAHTADQEKKVASDLAQPCLLHEVSNTPGAVREISAAPTVQDVRHSSRTDLTLWSNCQERPASAVQHQWEKRLTKEPMCIEVTVTFLNIEGIDTVTHSFSANIIGDFRVWYAGDLHNFDPKIRCSNLKESTMEPQMSQCKCSDGSYCFRRQWHGVFLEHLELHNFPMDIQNLSIEFTSDWPADMVKLVKCRSHPSKVTAAACEITRDSWTPTTLKKSVASTQNNRVTRDGWITMDSGIIPMCARSAAIRTREDVIEGAGLDDERLYPVIAFTLQFSRLTQHYFWNIITPTLIMVTLSFMSFTVPVNEVADRASITLTLLLSIIAYKFIIKDELPKVNFMTLIDKYILASMCIVSAVGFANAIVGNGADEITEDLKSADKTCKWILGTLWTSCNVGFMCLIVYRLRRSHLRRANFRKQCCDKAGSAPDVMLLV